MQILFCVSVLLNIVVGCLLSLVFQFLYCFVVCVACWPATCMHLACLRRHGRPSVSNHVSDKTIFTCLLETVVKGPILLHVVRFVATEETLFTVSGERLRYQTTTVW